MRDPYTAPEASDEGVQPARAPVWQTAISIVIAIYCSIQYVAIMHFTVTRWDMLMLEVEHPFLLVISKSWQPILLLASGLMLLLRRRLAIAGFAIYVVSAAVSFPILTSPGTAVGFAIVVAITVFAVFLDRTGRLDRR